MATHEMTLIAEMQAQLDVTKDRLGEALGRLEDLAQASWELATAMEWLLEEVAKPGRVRERVLARVAQAIEVFEEGESDE